MILQLFLILLIYAIFVFALVLIEHIAIRSADSLAQWMTLRRLAITATVAAVVVGFGVGLSFKLGWLKFGTPYDSPGFEEQLPETSKSPSPVGEAPAVKTKVPQETMKRASEVHKQNVKQFEKSP